MPHQVPELLLFAGDISSCAIRYTDMRNRNILQIQDYVRQEEEFIAVQVRYCVGVKVGHEGLRLALCRSFSDVGQVA